MSKTQWDQNGFLPKSRNTERRQFWPGKYHSYNEELPFFDTSPLVQLKTLRNPNLEDILWMFNYFAEGKQENISITFLTGNISCSITLLKETRRISHGQLLCWRKIGRHFMFNYLVLCWWKTGIHLMFNYFAEGKQENISKGRAFSTDLNRETSHVLLPGTSTLLKEERETSHV